MATGGAPSKFCGQGPSDQGGPREPDQAYQRSSAISCAARRAPPPSTGK